MKDIKSRFLEYVKKETTSDPESKTFPTTKTQLEFGKDLVEELKEIGLCNVYQDQFGYVYATLPSNTEKQINTVGFIAHMDTAPDMSGKNVSPQIINYTGGDIKLNSEYTMSVADFPFLENLVGEELITTDGTTLLGADDKAGIAIIISAMEEIINSNIEHGEIKIAFTPDEEVGKGADKFDVEKFNAKFAYTIDGGQLGELEYENFNAASATITISGKNVHPGSSKNIMVNSQLIAMELQSMLPVAQRPEYTENYEGFFLLTNIEGTVEQTKMQYIIRDHSMDEFIIKKELLKNIVEFLNKKYSNIISLELEDSYYNMKEKIMPHFEIVELAKKSMEEVGIQPIISPVRGGTDGARLSYMGLPCPNIFTGGMNFHGRYEFIPTSSLVKGKEVVIKIVENMAKN